MVKKETKFQQFHYLPCLRADSLLTGCPVVRRDLTCFRPAVVHFSSCISVHFHTAQLPAFVSSWSTHILVVDTVTAWKRASANYQSKISSRTWSLHCSFYYSVIFLCTFFSQVIKDQTFCRWYTDEYWLDIHRGAGPSFASCVIDIRPSHFPNSSRRHGHPSVGSSPSVAMWPASTLSGGQPKRNMLE